MFEWFPKYAVTGLAVSLSIALIASGVFYSAWWGPFATGVIIGVPAYLILTLIFHFFLKKLVTDEQQFRLVPWVAVISIVLIALVARQASRNNVAWPIHLQTPDFFHPKSFFLILIVIFLLLLLVAFGRSLSRGEGVAIESHWGGLGGGIGGFRLSTPLIYLLGILTLLLLMAAIGWQVYAPPENAQASKSPTPTPTTSPTPAPTPTATPTTTPVPVTSASPP